MRTPDFWSFLLLAAASYRVWRLIAEDKILKRPRNWLLRLGGWEQDGDPIPDSYRAKWGEFLGCPWCAGAWLSVGAWGMWLAWPTFTVAVSVPFAISLAVGLVSVNLDNGE